MPRRLVIGLVTAVVLAAGLPAGVAATAAGRSCAWQFELSPGALNVLYPDAGARYWFTSLPAAPGETLTLSGQYPHARYISFNSYDGQLRSADDLNDLHIRPDRGSTNPFLPGADRRATQREYHVTVVFARRPARAPANTLYTTSADGSRQARTFTIAYRVYRADRRLSESGGVDLPTVTVHPPAGGSYRLPDCRSDLIPSQQPVNTLYAGTSINWPALTPATGLNPPRWYKFDNAETSAAHVALESGLTGTTLSAPVVARTASLPQGGFANDADNAYIYAQLSSYYGEAVIIRGRVPVTPHTYQGQPRMAVGQLRYWSMCAEDTQLQRFLGCLIDDQLVTDARGHYTIVVTAAAHRPANAVARCGVNWLPAGPMFDTVLIVRNMLPAAGFRAAIQRARFGHERIDLGPYYPAARYASLAAVGAMGCRSASPDLAVRRGRSGRVPRVGLGNDMLSRALRSWGGRSPSIARVGGWSRVHGAVERVLGHQPGVFGADLGSLVSRVPSRVVG